MAKQQALQEYVGAAHFSVQYSAGAWTADIVKAYSVIFCAEQP